MIGLGGANQLETLPNPRKSATMSFEPVSRPWRRFLRVSVRGLIVLVLVIGAGLGWFVRNARIQRNAVAAITRAGGFVLYNWEDRNWNNIPGGKPWTPRWIVDLIGVDYFGHVTYVVQYTPTATDAEMAQVGGLTGLKELRLHRSKVTDAGLAHLSGLTEVSMLLLDGSKVTGAGLAHLKGMTNLSWLSLSSTSVGDTGLAHLKGLTNLTVLNLISTQVSDSGLAQLAAITSLKELSLTNTQVTDAGLAHLKGLINLSHLDLCETRVSDAGLVHLRGLTNLSELDLYATDVTGAGVRALKRELPRLKIDF
jgi:internalin A